jgi:kynurenine formamidase
MLRYTLLSILCLTAGTTLAQNADLFSGYRVVDMSYPYNSDTIYWPTADGFQLEPGFKGITDKGYYYSSNTLTTAEHGGTHIDALPIKTEGGSGGPLRMIGLVPK